MERPPQETWKWTRSILGDCEIVSQYAHSHGYSKLWRVAAKEERFWLKMHTYPDKWAGEVHALTTWALDLGLSPKVVAYKREPDAVILSECLGAAAETVKLSPAQEARMWSEAGAWLAKLHARTNDWLGTIAVDGSPSSTVSTDPESFVGSAFEKWIKEGANNGLLSEQEVAFVRFGMKEWLPSLRGETPRAVHRDYSPRNWLISAEGDLTAVIDFEHARWDVRAADLNRWWDHEFHRNPDLITAFFDAYGEPNERLITQMHLFRLLQAASGVVWATRVKDEPFAERNRAALQRVIADPKPATVRYR